MTPAHRSPLFTFVFFLGCFSPNEPINAEGGSETDEAGSSGGSAGTDVPTTTESGSSGSTAGTTPAESGDATSMTDVTGDTTTTGEPVCGDGKVEGEEVCDDAVNDGSYGGCSDDCAELGPHCGDETVQGSENCDDGDADNGDGCNIDCTVSGEVVWTRTFAGAATAVSTDGEDGLVVASADARFRKYSAGGYPDWDEPYEVPSASGTSGAAVAFDSVTGGWLVGGTAETVLQGTNSWWRRFDDDGILGTGATYDNPDHTDDLFAGLAFDPDNNYYIALSIEDPDILDDSDMELRKYDAAGDSLWSRTFDGGADDVAHSVAVAPDGSVVVAGATEVAGQAFDSWIRKYDAEGATEWTRTSSGGGNVSDAIRAVAVGADGSIAAVGEESNDVWVRLYSAGGVVVWTEVYDGPASGDISYFSDEATCVAVDSAGAVVVGGTVLDGVSDFEPWLRKYRADGVVLWTAAPEADPDIAAFTNGVAVDSDDYVIVVGSGDGSGWITKYTP